MMNMIKHKNKIIAGILSLVMVIGVFALIAPMEAQAVGINATNAGFYSLTYGTDGETTFETGAQIRAINETLANKGKNKSDAVYTTTDGVTWTTTDSLVWDGRGENIFYGVYPYNADYDKFTIPTDQSGGVQDADWMTATYTGAKSAGDVTFHFQHLLSRVTVNIETWNSEFDGAEKVITEPAIYSTCQGLSISYGTGEDGANVYTPVGAHTAITPATEVANTTFTAIVAPGTYDANEHFMTFTVDGQPLTVLAKANQLTNGLQPGKHYTFNLTVGKEAVTLSEVTVSDWADGGTIDGGVATECLHTTVENDYCSQCGKFLPTAMIGDTAYSTFEEALAAWTDGTTLTLMRDVADLTETVKLSDKSVTLNLNGHKITSSADDAFEVSNTAELTILDSGDGGSINGSVYVMGGTLNLESGTVNGRVVANGDFTMAGGCINSPSNSGILINGHSRVVVSGGEVSGTWGIMNYYGNLTVSGTAKITGTEDEAILGSSESTTTVIGGTFSSDPTEFVNTDTHAVTENDDGTWTVTAK